MSDATLLEIWRDQEKSRIEYEDLMRKFDEMIEEVMKDEEVDEIVQLFGI